MGAFCLFPFEILNFALTYEMVCMKYKSCARDTKEGACVFGLVCHAHQILSFAFSLESRGAVCTRYYFEPTIIKYGVRDTKSCVPDIKVCA